jgi:hypothetical protein
VSADRLKDAMRAMQALEPMHPYRRIYRAKVIAQSADLHHVDVRPFDPSLPDMAGIELRHGVPGIKVQVALGCSVQIGWDDGKPTQPFAALWSADATAVRVVIPATMIELGQENAPDFAVKGTAQLAQLSAAFAAISAALFKLGQLTESATVATAASQLPATLSTIVRVG